MHPTDSLYPAKESSSQRYVRDQLKALQENKADKAVVKSEIRRTHDRIHDNTNDIDEIKAHLLTEKPHSCLHTGEFGEMKKAIESNKELSEQALNTASLASDRGFKILMGAVTGLVTFGVAFVVWAVNVSNTANEASTKAARALETQMDAEASPKPPANIIMVSPEYLSRQLMSKKIVEMSPDQAAKFEQALEGVRPD